MTAAFAAWFAAHRDEFIALRRDLHAHPELAFAENRTAAIVADRLEAWGLKVTRGVARTGVVATLHGGPAAAIGLRADMDALPMQEANGFAHRSTIPGVMHACGHDGHTVILLAAARYLSETATALSGPIHFIFQPAEENEGGGRAMVEDGLFERFPVAAVFGLHNAPGIEVGHIHVRGGPITAGFDVFDFVVRAQGGHGAWPARGGDAITAAAALATQLPGIVSRHIDAADSVVLAVTRIEGGTAYNILPTEVRVSGSVRWFSHAAQGEIRRRLEMHRQGLTLSYGVEVELDYQCRYPPVINDNDAAQVAIGAARAWAGEDQVITEFAPVMGSEDFAFMLEARPGAYLLLGNGAGEGGCHVHSPRYDFNDEAIVHGAGLWVTLCQRFFTDQGTSAD
ncbi:MAG: amidohydrolase [Caulobacteraceae bacterium]|nr:amidohydrolase [Caulobacteraceae bacterium]